VKEKERLLLTRASGLFLFFISGKQFSQQLSTDMYSPKMVMSVIELNDIEFLKSFLPNFRFFFSYTIIDGKP